jgi:regulation of enolase protein 1 (concanavalin A-like superfamily)
MFVYRQLTGDGAIVARVASVQYADAWSKGGVMMRESLAAGSRHAFAVVSAANGIAFQRRPSTNGGTLHSGVTGIGPPAWVRLQRKGSTFTAARSADGVTWTSLGSETISMPATLYVGLAVTSHNAAVRTRALISSVSVTTPSAAVASGTLPAGWTSSNIGGGTLAGSATYVSNVFTIDGSGTDIWGTSDQFRYTYRQVSGDVDVIARVNSVEDVDAWSKGGVMIRRSLAAGSAHASLFVSARNGVAFQRRPADGGTSVHTAAGGRLAPWWVKLSRRGSAITAYQSGDGVTWQFAGTQTLSLASSFYVGVAVTSHNAAALARATFSSVSVTAASTSALPAGWASSDVGSAVLSGSASYASGVFMTSGAGADIWGTSDQFRFTYRQVTGDVDLVARVSTLQNIDTWTKAGVMIRRSLSASAGHASMFVSSGNGLAFQRRASDGLSSVHTAAGLRAAPWWVKLSRRGSTITAYQSADGNAWSTVGIQALSLPSTFYVGLAVTSHDPAVRAAATFTSVSVTTAAASVNDAPSVSLTSPAAGSSFPAPATLTLAASATDGDGTISRVEFFSGSTLIGADSLAPYSISWANVPAGTYSFVAVARDNDGAATVSSSRSVSVGGTTASVSAAPSVSLTSPAAGSSFGAPATIALAASASDGDGISRVEFYSGSALIGADALAPYTLSWTNVPAGTYSLVAVARDTTGRTTVSSTRSISVVAAGTPKRAVFVPSADHATAVQRYIVEFFRAGADPSVSNPVATVDVGKPPIVNGECQADVSGTISRLPAGSYIATVTAVGLTGAARSAPSLIFSLLGA